MILRRLRQPDILIQQWCLKIRCTYLGDTMDITRMISIDLTLPRILGR